MGRFQQPVTRAGCGRTAHPEVSVIKVLVVDDAIFMRSMIRDIFARGPFVIAGEAENGAEAVRLYSALRPDLTTMDIVMPQMDGITALREIMRLDPAAKVVMCSALGQEALISEAIEAGARDFIVKPFQPSRVLKVVQSVLGLDDHLRPMTPPSQPGGAR
jgi:two-component system chemotaxis response regulator CheY